MLWKPQHERNLNTAKWLRPAVFSPGCQTVGVQRVGRCWTKGCCGWNVKIASASSSTAVLEAGPKPGALHQRRIRGFSHPVSVGSRLFSPRFWLRLRSQCHRKSPLEAYFLSRWLQSQLSKSWPKHCKTSVSRRSPLCSPVWERLQSWNCKGVCRMCSSH